jgi:hypothetical protein
VQTGAHELTFVLLRDGDPSDRRAGASERRRDIVSAPERSRGVRCDIGQAQLVRHSLKCSEAQGEHEDDGGSHGGELRGDASAL